MKKYFIIVCGSVEVPDHFTSVSGAWDYCYTLLKMNLIESFQIYPWPLSFWENKTKVERLERVGRVLDAMKMLGKDPSGEHFNTIYEMGEYDLRMTELSYADQLKAFAQSMEEQEKLSH